MLNGRMFSSNKIPMKSYTWDGKTKYKINETQEEEKERLANWDKFLADVETSEETSENDVGVLSRNNATENTIDIDQAGGETVKREQYPNVSLVQLLFFLIFVLVMGNIYF